MYVLVYLSIAVANYDLQFSPIPPKILSFDFFKTLPLYLQSNLHLEKIKHPLSQTRMCTNKKSLWSKTKHYLQTNLQIYKKK